MKTILITGGNTGIGAAAALQLAAPGVHVVLACRSAAKTAPVLEGVRAVGARASFVELDLADLGQSVGAAEDFVRTHGALDLLIDNAGLGGQRGLTRDGFELAFGVNHLGHFAFTRPLLPLLEAARGRVVVVASGNHFKARSIPWTHLREATRSTTGLPEYAVSKLCNVLFTAELRRRHPRIGAVSLNPGRIASDIWRPVPWPVRSLLPTLLFMKSVEFGGSTLVHAAGVALDGPEAPIYWDKKEPKAANPLALREDLARELWAYSARAVGAALEHAPAKVA